MPTNEIEVFGGLFRLDGKSDEWVHYRTRSWTRQGIFHDIHVNRETGEVVCRCEDAMCRKKHANVFDKCEGGCKHARGLYIGVIGPYLERAMRERGL